MRQTEALELAINVVAEFTQREPWSWRGRALYDALDVLRAMHADAKRADPPPVATPSHTPVSTTTQRRGQVHTYVLDDGTTIAMCADHRNLIIERVTADTGHEPGGKWKCAVCTIHRRLGGGMADPKSVVCGPYIVTRYPDGDLYCTCPGWRFKRVPVSQRTCKHIDIVREQL